MIEIRAEKPEDLPSIRRVLLDAFRPSITEACLVELLRQARKASIALVAISDGQTVGHVMFSPVEVQPASPASNGGLGLAPVCVAPGFQKQGIGSQLIRRGLTECQGIGAGWVVVLGNPRFYERFGFRRAKDFHLGNEYGADSEFMVLELEPGALRGVEGVVKYQPAFQVAGG